ncbi:flagellar biosynthetic protein FliO [Acidithiobacillus sp. IBUN Pt1247-S3]|uniref:flagellar biosynthetic protein FliO n=1 Tax=Acidithiobacillus sp. IBUN Pt1247-S3 TaxID=3166642 RepID=UPI0034E41459
MKNLLPVKESSLQLSRLRHLSLLLLFVPLPAFAAQTVPAVFSPWAILRLIAALILVLLVFFALIWLFKRMQAGAVGVSGSPMRVLASLPLGTRERLLLVEVGKQQLLLGATPAGITLLHTLTEPLPMDFGSPAFSGWLRQAMERRKQGQWQNHQQVAQTEEPSSSAPVSSSEESSS